MNVNLRDLIEALPQDDIKEAGSDAEAAEEQLQAIFADLARRPAPAGSLHRLWTLGELSAQVALAYFAFWVRQWFADQETRKRRMMETNLSVALKMIHRLGYLRGAAAKLGQTLGNLPEILPDDVVSTLDKLHFEAPPMHFSLLREAVRNELGKDPEDLFESFDKEAFAAASLGQVHRATLKTGECVAVKIQYPGIARTIDADCRNLRALLFPARLGRAWAGLKAQFDEIHRMLKLEVDYEQEAENLRQARALFDRAEGIVVPEVCAEYSTKRVLTTEYVPGVHLPAFLATNPSQALRNAFGAKMCLAWYRLYYGQMSYADPHSGNYVFMNDGRLGLLDFGCVRRYGPEERELQRLAERLIDGTVSTSEFLKRACYATADDLANEEYVRLMEESVAWGAAPLRESPFDYGRRGFLKDGVDITLRSVSNKRYAKAHPMYVYWSRSMIGEYALLYLLRAKFDAKAIHDREVVRLG